MNILAATYLFPARYLLFRQLYINRKGACMLLSCPFHHLCRVFPYNKYNKMAANRLKKKFPCKGLSVGRIRVFFGPMRVPPDQNGVYLYVDFS